MPARSLLTVLTDGEIVQFRDSQAYFVSGQLVRADDSNKRYTSPTSFANDVSGGSINGWLQCRVMRDGVWKRLNELPTIAWSLTDEAHPPCYLVPPGPLKSETDKDAVEMPPRVRRVKVAAQEPVATAKSIPQTKSLIVCGMEAAEVPLPVRCVIRIPVRNCEVGSKSYWRHAAKEKLFQQLPNGSVGPYVGRLADGKIDTSIPDSDVEN